MLTLSSPLESDDEEAFETVRTLLTYESHHLPHTSRILLLRHLLPLLSSIASHSQNNKMTPVNLAVCVAPALARSDDPLADSKAAAGVRKFIEIGIERMEELAPRLPLRRGAGGMAHADKRRSTASTIDSGIGHSRPNTPPGAASLIQRKRLPALATATWENVDRKAALTRKPLPFESNSPSDKTHSPVTISPSESAFSRTEDIVPVPTQRATTVPLPVREEKPAAGPSRQALGSAKKSFSTPVPLPAFAVQPSPTRKSVPLVPTPPQNPLPKPQNDDPGRRLSLPETPGPKPLRRVASANFPSSTAAVGSLVAQRRRSFLMDSETKSMSPPPPPPMTERPVLRRIKSEAVTGSGVEQRAGAGVVAELSRLYEERAQSVEVLVRAKSNSSQRT